MVGRFQADEDDLILDPFCGTGTTLVECKKLGIDSVGIDANPASVLASQAKTDWSVDADLISQLRDEVLAEVEPISDTLIVSDTPLFSSNHDHSSLEKTLLEQSPEGQYLVESGMVERGWIDEIPLYITSRSSPTSCARKSEPKHTVLPSFTLGSSRSISVGCTGI